MKRRNFIRGGVAAGVAGFTGLPAMVQAGNKSGKLDFPLRLHFNENSLGLPQSAKEAIISGVGQAQNYPRQLTMDLTGAIARHHKLKPGNVVLGTGSTEVIQMMVQAVIPPGNRAIMAHPTFENVVGYGTSYGIQVERVPVDAAYSYDLTRMAELAHKGKTPVLVYICNPNNPTGTVIPVNDIKSWISSAPDNVHFLIDEAYYHFADDPAYETLDNWAIDNPNVVVTRTFSKIYGMGGLRVGYGLAHPDTAENLRQYATRININHFALLAGLAVLKDDAVVEQRRKNNEQSRKIVYRCFDELELRYAPSQANFVFFELGRDGKEFAERLRAEGILITGTYPAPYTTYGRVTIGQPEEMEYFAGKMRLLRNQGVV